jgi:THO complex subunit 7
MAAHYAISPMEDDVVIKQRLLTRTTTTRGEPPLKKLIKKFIAFATEIEKEGNNFNDCEKLYKSFLQELATFELPLLKTKAVIEANRREQESFKNLHVELNNQIAQVGTPSSLFPNLWKIGYLSLCFGYTLCFVPCSSSSTVPWV